MNDAAAVLESALQRAQFPIGEVRRYDAANLVRPSACYSLVPKTRIGQLVYRANLRKASAESKEVRDAILAACDDDILYFINAMCWIFEPRTSGTLPFNTWNDQDHYVRWMDECFGKRDCGCISEGTQVLTSDGWVAIEDVKPQQKLWDGVEWVRHEGLVFQGEKATLNCHGVWMTPDHLVLTDRGWRRADECWREESCVPAWDGGHEAVPSVGGHGGEVPAANTPRLEILRRTWDYCLRKVAGLSVLLGGHGGFLPGRSFPGAGGQQPGILSGELLLGYSYRPGQQPPQQPRHRYPTGEDDHHAGLPRIRGVGGHHQGSSQERMAPRGNTVSSQARRESATPGREEGSGHRKVRVYDILNCGPRRRFLVKGAKDFLVHNCEKSRGIGFSWLICAIAYYHWYFDRNCQIGFVSRTEAAVDTLDDPDSLMWKLDFLHKNMPEWFRRDSLKRTYGDHKFSNTENGSSIIGYEATGNVMTGGRKRAVFMDEFGKFEASQQQAALDSTQHVTNNRYFISTFKGSHTKFFAMMRREKSSMLKVIADWRDNPERARGLYIVEDDQVTILDKTYKFPPGYKFVKSGPFFREGMSRSPWYDGECRRTGATPASIAEELDREPEAPGSALFSEKILNQCLHTHVKRPLNIGILDFTPDTYSPMWIPHNEGNAKLWRQTDSRGVLTHGGPYAIGCDIAAGTGTEMASFSVLQVIDIQTKEQVLELSTNQMGPVHFAQLAYSVCKWISRDRGSSWAYLNWEANGIGSVFTKEIKRLGWGNCYTAEVPSHVLKKKTYRLGWTNQDGGESILLELQRAMGSGDLIVRSDAVIEDCRYYKRDERGKVIHTGLAVGGATPARSHGDRSCALAIAWMAARDRPAPESSAEAEVGSPDEQWEPYKMDNLMDGWPEMGVLTGIFG